jgi:hypothetical protein
VAFAVGGLPPATPPSSGRAAAAAAQRPQTAPWLWASYPGQARHAANNVETRPGASLGAADARVAFLLTASSPATARTQASRQERPRPEEAGERSWRWVRPAPAAVGGPAADRALLPAPRRSPHRSPDHIDTVKFTGLAQNLGQL